jgi:hypothetical protein
LAKRDQIFAAECLNKNISNVYQAKIPKHKRSMTLKIKRDKLDVPIFRQPERSENGYRISPDKPLKPGTWNRYLNRVGEKARFKQNFSHYCIRRAVLNAVNSMEPLTSLI